VTGRQLAGLGHGIVDARRRHGRCGQVARCQSHDGSLEFTLGAERVMELIGTNGGFDRFHRPQRFHPRFRRSRLLPFVVKEIAGMEVAIIGQAYHTRR